MNFSNSSTPNPQINTLIIILAKLLILWLFLPAGFNKLMHFEGTVNYISSIGLPFPTIAAISAIFIEVVICLLLLIGYKQKYACLILAIFTLVATFLFHEYWDAPAESAYMQQLLFNKNIAVVGGLLALFVAVSHPHSLSLDSYLKK